MDTEFGDWRARIIANLEASESGPLPTWTSYDTEVGQITDTITFNLVSSKDLGDPEMGAVLQWHLSLCGICKPSRGPAPFGVPARNFCAEYWDIIFEYQEYERDYAGRGNP